MKCWVDVSTEIIVSVKQTRFRQRLHAREAITWNRVSGEEVTVSGSSVG
jgi:hypothetical protein